MIGPHPKPTHVLQFMPSGVQPLGQHFVPPQQLPDEQQMVWLVVGFVHTLAVGQHTLLTQTVPLGQHMVEFWHTLFVGQHTSLRQIESKSQHMAPQQTAVVGGQVWPSGQQECPGRHSYPDTSHFSCVHGRRGSQNSGSSREKQEPPGP
ncbi:MAG: hypothetical protein ABW250_11920 [Pyrinomonadaceae bacterium]